MLIDVAQRLMAQSRNSRAFSALNAAAHFSAISVMRSDSDIDVLIRLAGGSLTGSHLSATCLGEANKPGLQFGDLGISRRDFAPEQITTGFRDECQYGTYRFYSFGS